MNPLIHPDQARFKGACSLIRTSVEVRAYYEWLVQRRATYVQELIRCTVPTDMPRLQGRVCELDDQLAALGHTEKP